MERLPSFRDDLTITHAVIDNKKYGLPKYKKFPMPDAAHVRSAIKFFNYVKPSHEKELANAILSRMKDFNIDIHDINIGDNNRFKKYIQNDSLAHHGIKGMRWGVRRYQNPDGSLTPAGKKRYNELVTPEGNYTQKALDTNFDKKVAKGVKRYINNKKISDPFVQEVINQNKDYIDALIAQEKNKRIREQNMRNNQYGAQFAMENATRASEQAREASRRNMQIQQMHMQTVQMHNQAFMHPGF